MQKCMDWRGINFDWNQARAFLVTAREGSYSAAALALGVAQPTIGRQVAALEAELGVTLFERVGREAHDLSRSTIARWIDGRRIGGDGNWLALEFRMEAESNDQ